MPDNNRLPGDFDNENVWRYWLYNTVKKNDERYDTVVARLNTIDATLHTHAEAIDDCQQRETANHILTKDTNEKVCTVIDLLKPSNNAHDTQIQQRVLSTVSPQGVITQQTTNFTQTLNPIAWVVQNPGKSVIGLIAAGSAFEILRNAFVWCVHAAQNYGK